MTEHLTAADLGLDMATDEGLFGWFVASLLFGRPVQQTVAANTWKLFQQDGYTTPESFIEAGSSVIDHELWQGKYRHLVGVMAEELPRVMKDLIERYGSVAALVAGATSREDLTARLESFKGVGPKTAEIFIRELPDADNSQDN
jgi:endonuclease III